MEIIQRRYYFLSHGECTKARNHEKEQMEVDTMQKDLQLNSGRAKRPGGTKGALEGRGEVLNRKKARCQVWNS